MMFVTKEYFYLDEFFSEYDYDFLKKLSDVWGNIEGSTFWSPNLDQQKIQLQFHKKCFSKLNPKNILEVGTHKANYSYFCKKEISDIKIVTFGIDPESQICVDLVNDYYGEKFIEFHCGDSAKTLSEYSSQINFDVAWVDGGHDFNHAYSDLNNCNRLGIKNILIDDTILLPEVRRALDLFLSENQNFKIVDESKEERGIVWISTNM